MFNFVRLSDGGIARLHDVRPEVTILSDIADALLTDVPVDFKKFKQHRKIREAIARVVPGMEQLADIDVAKQEFHVRGRLLHAPEFKTDDGRARFCVGQMPDRPDVETLEKYPIRLMTVRSEGQFNTIIYEEKDSYRPARHRWSIMMNPGDMRRIGLNEGDTADIHSRYGRMNGVQVHGFDVPIGDAMAYFPEANVLIGREIDPRSKTPGFKSVAIAIDRID